MIQLAPRSRTPDSQFSHILGSFRGVISVLFCEQKLEFRPLRAKPTDTDVTVQVRVIQPGQQPVPLDYSMEKTPTGWKVYDVMVGGVSLVANYRTEFATVVRSTGIDGLIRDLQNKNKALERKPAAQAGTK